MALKTVTLDFRTTYSARIWEVRGETLEGKVWKTWVIHYAHQEAAIRAAATLEKDKVNRNISVWPHWLYCEK